MGYTPPKKREGNESDCAKDRRAREMRKKLFHGIIMKERWYLYRCYARKQKGSI